jgi:hypothetical protein
MKKIILSILASLVMMSALYGQNISAERLDQIKRVARKNDHISVSFKGEIIKSIYSHESTGGYLKAVAFKVDNGDLMELSFPSSRGIEIQPIIHSKKEVMVTVSCDEKLLREYEFKGEDIKDVEKALIIEADLSKMESIIYNIISNSTRYG